jgi:hypothetical protein
MSPAKKAVPKKAPGTKAVAKRTAAKKAAPSTKAAAKKTAVKKTAVKKAAAKKTGVKKATAAKKPTRRATARKSVPAPPEVLAPRPARQPEPSPEDLREYLPPEGPPVDGPAAAPGGGEPYRRRPDTAVLTFEGPGPQRRLTVAFRIILAIPHLVLLWLISIAAIVAAVIGWFAALILGRLPRGLARFLGQYLQYSTRVSGYAFYLLTDRYPPFSLTDAGYAISVDLAPGRLNRAAVFFRIILMLPAALLANILQSGLEIAGVFIWLIVLVSGRLPTSLFEALAVVLRYVTRLQAFGLLLTADYPSGLFGDPA